MALWLDGAEAIGAEGARRELNLLVVEKPLNMAAFQDNTGGGGSERGQRGRVSIGWAHTTSACPMSLLGRYVLSAMHPSASVVGKGRGTPMPRYLRCAALRAAQFGLAGCRMVSVNADCLLPSFLQARETGVPGCFGGSRKTEGFVRGVRLQIASKSPGPRRAR